MKTATFERENIPLKKKCAKSWNTNTCRGRRSQCWKWKHLEGSIFTNKVFP